MKRRKLGTLEVSEIGFGCMNATQESQKGKPAQELAKTKPNVMINGHQDWLDGLVAAARKARS